MAYRGRIPRLSSRCLRQAFRKRHFSTAVPERVEVRCGSSGYVTIDLYNVLDPSSSNNPLLIHLPPCPQPDGSASHLPPFLQHCPVATINYRWSPYSRTSIDEQALAPLHWPTPVHDTSFAVAWLLENLSPPRNSRRDIYVYGSYLGASLATSLALTEAHTHARFGVRGLMAYNGIYNWTMFLPDHRINKPPSRRKTAAPPPGPVEGSHLFKLQEKMPALFNSPSNLFDPFASPSLFFHSPGLFVPESFLLSVEHAALINNMAGDEEMTAARVKTPRKSHLIFPPRQSTLKIPETLILYDSARSPTTTKTSRTSRTSKAKPAERRGKAAGHSFEAQAREFVELMRRSVDVVELKERSKWDEDIDCYADEAMRRVQLVDVGPETDSVGLRDAVCDMVSSWMEKRLPMGS